MLSRPADSLLPADAAGASLVYEPKWDGWRALWGGGRVWSRHGKDLTRFCPDLAPVLRGLPADLVLDGELVVWNHRTGRLDFAALSGRLTAGRRLSAWVAAHPAHLVLFDLLAADETDLRPLPLVERRERLAGLAARPPLELCPQTAELAVAEQWLVDQGPAGLEGIMVKRADEPYRPSVRGWWKVRAYHTAELLIVGVVGSAGAPVALHLAATDPATSRLVTVGASSLLTRPAARMIAGGVTAVGPARHRRLGGLAGMRAPVLVIPVEPLAAEFLVDAAVDAGRLRHPARFLRLRPDLAASEVIVDRVGGTAP